jgi:hypothetical protein
MSTLKHLACRVAETTKEGQGHWQQFAGVMRLVSAVSRAILEMSGEETRP